MVGLLLMPALPLKMDILPEAEAVAVTLGNETAYSGSSLGDGVASAGSACTVRSGTANGWLKMSDIGGIFAAGQEDGNRCYIGLISYDLSGIPTDATISNVSFIWPSTGWNVVGTNPLYKITVLQYFDGATCSSTTDHSGDDAFYQDVINFTNPVVIDNVDAESYFKGQTFGLNSNASAAMEERLVSTFDNGWACFGVMEAGVPKTASPSTSRDNFLSDPPELYIVYSLDTTITITIQMYDSTNSTQLVSQIPSVKVGMINGSETAYLDCSSTCSISRIEVDTPIRLYAQYDGHNVKINGENSYNRTCSAGGCDIKIPVSVYASTSLVFYDSTGSGVSITSFDIIYSNSTSSTVSVGAASKSLEWLPNGTQTINSVLSPTGLELNASSGFNVTANGQTYSFLLSAGKIELTLNLFANDMTTPVSFNSPEIRILSVNGSVSSFIPCSTSCTVRVFDEEEIGIQSQWNSLGVNTNTTNMLNMTVNNGDSQSVSLKLSLFSVGFEFQSIDKTLNIIPDSFVYTLSNGTEITQSAYDPSWFRNTTLTVKEINYHGTNMNTNATIMNIEDSGNALFYLDYFMVTLTARNSANTSPPVDSIQFKLMFANGTQNTFSTDAGGIFTFYLGNHTTLNVYAMWENLIVNSTQVSISSASDSFFIPTTLYKDASNVVFFAVNNTDISNIRTYGIEIQFWSNHTESQILKYKYNSEKYLEPKNFRLNGTNYNSPALSWNWNDVTRILSLDIPFSSGYNFTIVTPYNPSWGNSTIITGLSPSTQMLFSGNLIGAALAPYTAIMGLWVYLLLASLPVIMTYIKSQSVGITILTISITTFAFIGLGEIVLLPATGVYIAYLILAVCIAITMYRLLKRDD